MLPPNKNYALHAIDIIMRSANVTFPRLRAVAHAHVQIAAAASPEVISNLRRITRAIPKVFQPQAPRISPALRLRYGLQYPLHEEISRNINRQSAPKYLGLTMACRHFGLVQQIDSAEQLPEIADMSEANILAAADERQLCFPKQFRIKPKRGEVLCIRRDLSTLTTMLQKAREQLDSKNRKRGAAAESTEETRPFWESVRKYKAWAAVLPSKLQLGGTYVLPHLLLKHALAWYMVSWGYTSASEFIARLFELDGRRNQQPDITTMEELLSISPDQRQLMSTMPPHLTPLKLSHLLKCPLIMVPCFACLWQEACDKLSVECEQCQANPKAMADAAAEYLGSHHCAPCPYVLVRAATRLLASAATTADDVAEDALDEEDGV